jgi:hypothetical protein
MRIDLSIQIDVAALRRLKSQIQEDDMDKKDELIEDKREPYTQPLLTRHEPLRALTGKSGEKDPITDKDPSSEKGDDGLP